MELWIRSQDKTKFVKVSKVEMRCSYSEFVIIGDLTTLARYQTIERALEILDEIETAIAYCSCDLPDEIKEIKKKIKSYFAMNLKTNSIVYEMPKE